MKEKLLEKFSEVFGNNEDVNVYFAPGRVNLIGEHTDYNGGHVFPSALTIGTYAAASKNKEGIFRFYSMNFEELGVITIPLKDFAYKKEDDWTNYPKGVIWALREKGFEIEEGVDIAFYGNIPNASGLSSSASVEVLTGYILKELFTLDIDMVQIALVSQLAENKFNGVNCGIMDQFSIAMGKKDNAIFLDTSNLEYEYAPIKLESAKIVIACSNKKRGLGDSKYNERRQECEDALALLKTVVNINSLGELSEEEFEKHKDVIQDEIKIRRARHAVYENQRTIKAVNALKAGNIELFGQLMKDSHVSLRDDYEVTGLELDTLFEAAWEQEGIIGSRMTGAGFGGCTVSIVKEDSVDTFVKNVGSIYLDKIGYSADFYVVDIGDGPTTL
ncbi:MAG: galactokinase [Anaerocolumna sp.]|jgi:galactokinase|nr:galactokinase [Anaerocolumna sp.]